MSIKVRCKRKLGDKEAEPISDSLITLESMAISRGKRFLDDPSKGGYYIAKEISLQVPHKSANIVPGAIVDISDVKTGMSSQNVRVNSYKIKIERSGKNLSVFGYIDGQIFTEPD